MQPLLEVNHVGFSYHSESGETTALSDITFSLKEGEFVTILGSNGAGKSTLFNAICGNFLLDEGSVILDGKNISLPAETSPSGFHRPFIPGPDERTPTELAN